MTDSNILRMTLELDQNSPEWESERTKIFTYCGSDTAAMLAQSKHETRASLMKRLAIAWRPDHGDFQQKIFDKGHEIEDSTRPFVEDMVGEDLFPDVGYCAFKDKPFRVWHSCDGLNLNGTMILEVKQWNDPLVNYIQENQDLPKTHWPQVEQGLFVFDADLCLFVVSRGANDFFKFEYKPRKERQLAILSGWDLFHNELIQFMSDYEPEPEKTEIVVSEPINDGIPNLVVRAEGKIISSNFDDFQKKHRDFIESAPKTLSTDQDFFKADKFAKKLRDIIDKLETAKNLILSQTGDIDKIVGIINELQTTDRKLAIDYENQVKKRKDSIKEEIIFAARKRIEKCLADYQELCSPYPLTLPHLDFAVATKNIRSLDSFRDAVDGVRIKAIDEIKTVADVIKENSAFYKMVASDYTHVFPDLNQIITKSRADFEATIKARIAEAKTAEERKAQAAAQQSAHSFNSGSVQSSHGTGPVRASFADGERVQQDSRYGDYSKGEEIFRDSDEDDILGDPGDWENDQVLDEESNNDLLDDIEKQADSKEKETEEFFKKIDRFIQARGYKTRTASTVREAIIAWSEFQ